MPAAGAAHAQREVRLPFLSIEGEEEKQQIRQAAQEPPGRAGPQYIVADSRVESGEPLEGRNEVRVVEKADVHHHVGLDGDPVPVTEGDDAYLQTAGPLAAEPSHEGVPQLVDVELGCVDDGVGHLPERRENPPLFPDRAQGAAPGRKGVLPPRFAESPHERLVRGVEEEDMDRAPPPRQFVEDPGEVGEKLLSPNVHPEGHPGPFPPRFGDDVDDLGKENRRQVVHAIVSEVLEHLDRRALPRPRQSGHDDNGGAMRPRVDGGHGEPRPLARCAWRSSNCRAEWTPSCFSRWFRAATSTIVARFRPGEIGMRRDGSRTPRISMVSSSRPSRSYSLDESHSSIRITSSIFFIRVVAVAPNRSRTLMIPSPRISMLWEVRSFPRPTRVAGPSLSTWIMSSATSRWPRRTRSRAHSLLPIPLRPERRTPTPMTSRRTPWTVVVSVKRR